MNPIRILRHSSTFAPLLRTTKFNNLISYGLPTGIRRLHSKSTLFINPCPDSNPELTIPQILADFEKVLGFQKEYGGPESVQAALDRRQKLMDLLPASRNELPPRTMADSFVSAVVPLGRDEDMRERYTTFDGHVRTGRILEDLDIFAGWCCLKHILNPRSEGYPNPYSCVTALVDFIHLGGKTPLNPFQDVRFSGHLSWVGKSSMEVQMLLDQKNADGKYEFKTMAVFVFVARDPLNRGPALVNPLVGNTEAERQYIQLGEERSKLRKLAAKEALHEKPPNEEEREIIHKQFMEFLNPTYGYFRPIYTYGDNMPGHSGAVQVQEKPHRMMNDTRLTTLLLCHPQYRNRFNKVFGGFIMRQAYEIAFANVYLYAKSRPVGVAMDDILFRKPVEIGSLLRFGTKIGYVEGRYIHVPVIAEVVNPKTGENELTNVFQFTFRTQADIEPPPSIMPHTYQEAMLFLKSRRHFKDMVPESNSLKQ